MRVFFIGAQSTGKTTVIRELEKLGYPCLQHITRDTISKNKLENKSSDKTTTETQSLIFDAYVKAFNENDNFICDRSLIDVASYTSLAVCSDTCDVAEINREVEYISEYYSTNKDTILMFYFPIEFRVESDGLRCIDEEYRAKVDKKMNTFVSRLYPKYYTVTGTVEERVEFIKNILDIVKFSK